MNFLRGVIDVSTDLGNYCESVPFGSRTDFLRFYDGIQPFEDAAYSSGQTPQQARDIVLDLLDSIERSCQSSNDVRMNNLYSEAVLSYSLMGLCFDDIYAEFGEFPAMHYGLSD